MDDVVLENVILKSFPLFDIEQVEVIRGPPATLFGRNTTAGIVKFASAKPRQDFDAYTKLSVGSFGSRNVEACYDIPVSTGEIYFYTDVAVQGKTNLYLYESAEFLSSNMEAGLRIGYQNYDGN